MSEHSVEHIKRTSKHAKDIRKQYAKQQRRKTPRDTLPSPTLDIPLDHYISFVTHLKSSKRVLALFGAGLSAASGIPTFRGPGGFWREHDSTQLGTPEAFEKDPSLVWQFTNYRRHTALKAKPNRAHYALAKLAEKHFTNPVVPSLALPTDCPISDARFPLPPIPTPLLPHCPQCKSLLRPAIVWFGEQTVEAARARIHTFLDAGKVDLMLVVGTSATVWPAAIYIHSARIAGARIAVFNTEELDKELQDPSQRLREQDWFFRGDAAAIIPDVLKEVIGVVPKN
ncbi:MAG: hypothetical protein Q9186_007200 [Xanthomendoza sp. 1 TL-2023]